MVVKSDDVVLHVYHNNISSRCLFDDLIERPHKHIKLDLPLRKLPQSLPPHIIPLGPKLGDSLLGNNLAGQQNQPANGLQLPLQYNILPLDLPIGFFTINRKYLFKTQFLHPYICQLLLVALYLLYDALLLALEGVS